MFSHFLYQTPTPIPPGVSGDDMAFLSLYVSSTFSAMITLLLALWLAAGIAKLIVDQVRRG